MRTDDLIASLTGSLRPVRRVRSAGRATALWSAVAVSAVGLAIVHFGLREDFAQRFGSGAELVRLLAAVATGILAAFAAMQCALPDRGWRWALLPVPAIAVWMAALGWGCVEDVMASGREALRLTTSFQCVVFISGLGVPLAVGMLWQSRHAALVRPERVAALCGLAAAAVASAGLSCIHSLNAAAMILVWHGLAVALVTGAVAAIGPRFMRAALPR
jgi:hypothetical protein